MANCINNCVIIEGPRSVVDRFIENGGLIGCSPTIPPEANWNWFIANWGTKWIDSGEVWTLRQSSSFKSVACFYDSAWAAPYQLLFHAITMYHREGLRFHLSWKDEDGGLTRDPLFGDELIITGGCFAEAYTPCEVCGQAIQGLGGKPASELTEKTSVISFTLLEAGKTTDVGREWSLEVGVSYDAFLLLAEFEAVDMLRTIHPGAVVLIHRFPKPNAVMLSDRITLRDDFIIDLILKTWGGKWFHERDILCDDLKESDLSEAELDSLICAAYPAKAEQYLRAKSRRGQPMSRVDDSNDEDYFARLARDFDPEATPQTQ